MKHANKILLVLIASVLFLYACSSTDNSDTGKTNEQQNPGSQEQTNKSAAALTANELFEFELLRADWTDEQMINLGLKKEVNELAGERTYSNESVMYSYGNIYGNNKTPDWMDVYGVIDVKGPRDIAVGDSFEDVLKKFPQQKDWKTSPNGEFYGEVSKENYIPTGIVIENGDAKKIIVWPQDGVPSLHIFFKDDKVEHYTIYIQNIFD